MESSKVPQHNVSTHVNIRKAIYAVDDNGKYSIVPSSGWEVEEEATNQALAELRRLADIAYEQATAGKVAPLCFHMYDRRMDLQTLAAATGLFKWRIRRHLKPGVFNRLPRKMLARYGDTLGISVAELCTLPQRIKNSG